MRDLTKYRLERVTDFLSAAKILLLNDSCEGSINRSYYAMFTAIRALLAEKEIELRKHSAVIGYFRKNYVKTGIFDEKFSDYIGKAFVMRNDCDYADFFFASFQDAETQYNHAVEFYEAVKNFLEGGEL